MRYGPFQKLHFSYMPHENMRSVYLNLTRIKISQLELNQTHS